MIADLHLLHEQCQALIDTQLIAANQCHISYDYQPGDQILVLSYKPDKLAPRALGPFPIECVHTNGTVTICHNNLLTEHINLHCIRPYHQ